MKRAWMLLLLVPLAGCLDGDEVDEGPAAPAFQQAAADPFFANVTVRGDVDLSVLSQPIHDILPVQEQLVTMSDGVNMHNALYLPDGEGPFPVFINFSPYWGDTAETMGDNFGKYLIENFVPRGYAVVLSAIRGTGHSEGCFEVASDREALDLKEVIDHYATQPWSNGHVAAGGKSYDSTTQNAVIAKFPTPNLKAIFHVSGITDMYSYTFHNGLWARADAGLFTTVYSAGQGTNEGFTNAEGTPDGAKILRTTGDLTCQENLETVAIPVSTYATGAKTDYWIERDWTRDIGNSEWDGSIFFYHGFHDWNVQPSHIQPWIDNLPDQIDVKLWLHQDKENLGHLYPMRTDWNLTFLRWLDQELKGIDTGFWDEPRNELQGTDLKWRAMDTWPAAPTAYAFEDNSVSVGNVNIGVGLANTRTLVLDREFLELDGAYRLAGSISATFAMTATTADPAVTMIVRVGDTWVGEASLRAIFRDSLEVPTPVVPGTPVTYTLETYPLDVIVPAGQDLVLEFGGAPEQVIPVPTQMQGNEYDLGDLVLGLPLAPVDALAIQPEPMPCIAC